MNLRTMAAIGASVAGGVLLAGAIVVASTPEFRTSDSDTTSARSTTITPVDVADTSSDVEAMREQAYIRALDRGGVDYSSRDAALHFGRTTCNSLDGGIPWERVLVIVMETGRSADDAGYMMGASTAAFCPQHNQQ